MAGTVRGNYAGAESRAVPNLGSRFGGQPIVEADRHLRAKGLVRPSASASTPIALDRERVGNTWPASAALSGGAPVPTAARLPRFPTTAVMDWL